MVEQRVAAADGTEIAWSETGEGAAVILVHGITESSTSWAPVTQRLAASHRVITLDLRGHGQSGNAERYDLEAMAGDVLAVAGAAGADRPHLVGHSLGGAVVSAVGAVGDVASVVDVDQSLRLGGFKAQLDPAAALLRDEASFPVVIEQLFESMRGELSDAEFDRISAARRPDQNVVLGVWELILASEEAEIEAVVEAALGGYAGRDVPYLALFGIDPGDDYGPWLSGFIDRVEVEVWDGAGHYPHLVDPDRFVERLRTFWD